MDSVRFLLNSTNHFPSFVLIMSSKFSHLMQKSTTFIPRFPHLFTFGKKYKKGEEKKRMILKGAFSVFNMISVNKKKKLVDSSILYQRRGIRACVQCGRTPYIHRQVHRQYFYYGMKMLVIFSLKK